MPGTSTPWLRLCFAGGMGVHWQNTASDCTYTQTMDWLHWKLVSKTCLKPFFGLTMCWASCVSPAKTCPASNGNCVKSTNAWARSPGAVCMTACQAHVSLGAPCLWLLLVVHHLPMEAPLAQAWLHKMGAISPWLDHLTEPVLPLGTATQHTAWAFKPGYAHWLEMGWCDKKR